MCEIDKAIEYFRNNNTEAHIYCSNSKHCDNETLEMFRMNDLAIRALKEKKQREWVKCSERLPNSKVRVLITKDIGMVDVGFCNRNSGNEWRDSGGYPIADPLAWQPLPQPYKEAEHE